MTVTFNQGLQTMNGERALVFVRSRHAEGVEGSDIAREARQQLVLSGVIKKLTDPKVFTNISIDKKLLDIAQNSIQTDLGGSEMATTARYAFNAINNLKSYSIPDELLVNPQNEYLYHNEIFTHAFVFIPSKGENNWSDVQSWVKMILP
jgi:anionic cell wall polymer biosynthesis LytR-Cps2A-Psr (LCP) family protein